MENPLWTEKYEPELGDIRQDTVRENIRKTKGMNLILSGPVGSGKTATARALAKELHGSKEGMTEINVADFFNRSKKEIRNDKRFESFLKGRSQMAKRDMINHVITESASYQPVGSSNYRTILLDNAEAIREDFQQSLRRTIERNHETAQFIIATREPSNIIPPIQSRFFNIPIRKPTGQELESIIVSILESEQVPYTDTGIRRIVGYSDRNIRTAVLTAQSVSESKEEITADSVDEVVEEVDNTPELHELLELAISGDYKDMRDRVEDMVVEESYSVTELIRMLNRTVESEYGEEEAMKFQIMAGNSESRANEGRDRTVHVSELLTNWSKER